MSLPQLPAEYHKAASIRLDRERKTAIKLTLWSVAIFAGLVLLRVMFGLFLPAVRLQFPEDLVFLSLMAFGILLGSLVAAILHEIIHAVYMKHAGAKGVKFGFTLGYAYTAAPQAFFSREEYLRITLAPAVILNPILLIGSLLFLPQLNLVLYVDFALHLAGCVGDFYVAHRLRRASPRTLVRDTGVSMDFYEPDADTGVRKETV